MHHAKKGRALRPRPFLRRLAAYFNLSRSRAPSDDARHRHYRRWDVRHHLRRARCAIRRYNHHPTVRSAVRRHRSLHLRYSRPVELLSSGRLAAAGISRAGNYAG